MASETSEATAHHRRGARESAAAPFAAVVAVAALVAVLTLNSKPWRQESSVIKLLPEEAEEVDDVDDWIEELAEEEEFNFVDPSAMSMPLKESLIVNSSPSPLSPPAAAVDEGNHVENDGKFTPLSPPAAVDEGNNVENDGKFIVLPEPSDDRDYSGPSKVDVLVIGAGWAGIAAVQELHEKGISNVLVLEAEDYIGGRSKSFNLGDGSINRSSFELSDDNIPLDIGSEWLYDSGDMHDFLWDETELLSRVDLNDETDYWPQLYRQTPDGTTKRMSDNERNELYYTIWREFDDFRYDLGDRYDSYSLQDAYNQFVSTKIEDEKDQQYLNLVLDALSIEYGAEIDHFRQDGDMFLLHANDSMYYMSRRGAGFGNIARAVAEPYIDKIELNSKLTSIDYRNPSRVVAEFDKNGKAYAVQARSAIVTVSLGVLQANTISFNPKLPRRKLEAMAGLGFGLLNKCIMVWEEGTSIPDEKWFNLMTPEDETSGIWTTFSSFTEYKSLPTIVGWIGGDEARNMEEMTDDEIMREVWNHLSSIYPSITQPKHVYISRWGQEENFRGSYSHGKWRSSHSTASRILGERIGNVHFAGEATAYPWYGTTRGAWDSGKRAANEIYRRVNSWL